MWYPIQLVTQNQNGTIKITLSCSNGSKYMHFFLFFVIFVGSSKVIRGQIYRKWIVHGGDTALDNTQNPSPVSSLSPL